MEGNVGRKIDDIFCCGAFGPRYDLRYATIEVEGHDWFVIRLSSGKPEFIKFKNGSDKQEFIDRWCNPVWGQLETENGNG